MSRLKTITENDFRYFSEYGKHQRSQQPLGSPPRMPERVKHGNALYPFKDRARCQYYGEVNWTQRKFPDCDFNPQVQERDCHSNWHKPAFDEERNQWFISHREQEEVQLGTLYTRSKAVANQELSEVGDTHDQNELLHIPQNRSEALDVAKNWSEVLQSQSEVRDVSQNQSEVLQNQSEVLDVSQNQSEVLQSQSEVLDVSQNQSEVRVLQSQSEVLDVPQNQSEGGLSRGRPKGSINKRRRRGCYKRQL